MKITRRTAVAMLGSTALTAESLLAAPLHPLVGESRKRPRDGAAQHGAMSHAALDTYDLVWTSPSRNAGESMPCGGGDIGLNVWVEGGDLLCYLSRSGAFDELNGFPKFGRLRFQLSPNPFTADATFEQRLHLAAGFVEIVATRQSLSTTVRIWVDVHAPLVHVEAKADHDISMQVHFEAWRLARREDLPGEDGGHRSYVGAPVQAIHWPDDVGFVGDDVVATHHTLDRFSAFDLCVEQQGLKAVKDRMWNPLHNLCFGTVLRGKNFETAGLGAGQYASTPFQAWTLRSRLPARQHHVRACLYIATVPERLQWLQEAMGILQADEQAGQAPRQATEAWWQQFWQRSFIHILPGSPQPDRPEWRVGRNYQVFRYQLGCNAFGRYPTKFNGGLFTVDPEFVRPDLHFDPDYRLWGGGSFTAQNQRMVYWPLLKSGDFDLMEAQFTFYDRARTNAEVRTEAYWKHRGASFTEQIESFGLPVAFEYGWHRPPALDPGIEWSRYVDRLWDTSLEFCLMILDVERFTSRDIRRYLPLLMSCVTFFDEHYQQQHLKNAGVPLNSRGELVFFPGTALETYKDTLNSAVTIAGLTTVVSRLLELPERYLTEADRHYLREYLRRLPPLPYREMNGHRVLAPAELWDRIQNVELPQLYPVFPYPFFGVGRPELQVAMDTWRYGVDTPQQKNFISWHQDAIFCARLGLTDEAAAITLKKLDDAPRRCPTFWGPGHDWVPDHNWGGSGMVGLQEMLLQTVDRKLILFPSWPAAWDVDFKLRAPYETTVQASLRGETLTHLLVTPAERQRDVVLPAWLSPAVK